MKGVGEGGRRQEVIERGDTEKKGGRQRRQGESFLLNNDIMFSTYLIWHQLPRGLFSYELECYSIWVLRIYPQELFVLTSVSNSAPPPAPLIHKLPFWKPRADINLDECKAYPPSGKARGREADAE